MTLRPDTDEEELRERLLDLENLREREARLRREAESLLAGLRVLGEYAGDERLFPTLLEALRPAFAFEDAVVLGVTPAGGLAVEAATRPDLWASHWCWGRFLRRVRAGECCASFDAASLEEWAKQPDWMQARYASVLALPLSAGEPGTFLVALHGQPHVFSRRHIELGERFAPLAAHALSNLALVRRNRQLAAAIEATRVGVFLVCAGGQHHGRLPWANPAMTALTGYTASEMDGPPWRVLACDSTDPAEAARLDACLDEGEAASAELALAGHGGRRLWCTLELAPVAEQGKASAFIGILTDVTDRKAMEQSLRDNEVKLRRAVEELNVAITEANSANQAKSDFLANMSHELRTPLNAIIGFAEVMKEELYGPLGAERYRAYSADILDSGRHLLSLINDILDLSKIEAGRQELDEETVDVPKLMATVLRITRERAELRNQHVSLDIDDGFPALACDPRMLRQVLINLLSNAIKFSNDGAEIRLVWWISEETGTPNCAVSDTGIGMDPEDVPRALRPFGQITQNVLRKHEGTGLGLTISKQLVELHGGAMEVDTMPGRGTTVTVSLPADRVLAGAIRDLHDSDHEIPNAG